MSNVEVIKHYFNCVNGEDYEALREVWHPDVTWRATAARPRSGIDDVMTYYPRALALYPKHFDDPVRIIDAGDTVTVEIVFDGETADGKPIHFEAIDIFDFEDGKIIKFSSWFDIDVIRAQL